jgi:predicted transcriptional regulator of viral defense system
MGMLKIQYQSNIAIYSFKDPKGIYIYLYTRSKTQKIFIHLYTYSKTQQIFGVWTHTKFVGA